MFVNNALSFSSHARFYTSLPAMSLVALAEVLITVSLCVLLYERGSRSAVPRTKNMLNTLIIYAVNRCFLSLLIVIGKVTVDADDIFVWMMALTFITPKLYANSLLASLNAREHLRSQSWGKSDLYMNAVHVSKLPKLSGDRKSSKERGENSNIRKRADIDIAAVSAHDATTALRREGKV
ncbi:hypothetical protein F5J12DRAFT_105717 [Pisolithus orientalis]|uniref:uncharacterized protein n=1 Tax=Pisolithus orientalis TaxID=936130 RepID=UPI0022256747|nr:uncharacterized protein F5J12DRAFT_105717 [Pisolithus orientalis]KAI6006721.1 hypothetical protein F5J12DRAFT_105717 [Pisolithus orientalis]